MSFHSLLSNDVPTAPGTIDSEDCEEVLVSRGGKPRLHLPNGDRPRCGTDGAFVRKPLSVYPPAHRTWCRTCLRLWEETRDADAE
jgi:hypothetical protein